MSAESVVWFRTPEQWCRITGVQVMDPDGWDRRNFTDDWRRPLTWQEFRDKASISTISAPADWQSRGQAVT